MDIGTLGHDVPQSGPRGAGESCCLCFPALFRGDWSTSECARTELAYRRASSRQKAKHEPKPVFASTRPQAQYIVRKHLSGPAHTAQDPQQAFPCPRTPAVSHFLPALPTSPFPLSLPIKKESSMAYRTGGVSSAASLRLPHTDGLVCVELLR